MWMHVCNIFFLSLIPFIHQLANMLHKLCCCIVLSCRLQGWKPHCIEGALSSFILHWKEMQPRKLSLTLSIIFVCRYWTFSKVCSLDWVLYGVFIGYSLIDFMHDCPKTTPLAALCPVLSMYDLFACANFCWPFQEVIYVFCVKALWKDLD